MADGKSGADGRGRWSGGGVGGAPMRALRSLGRRMKKWSSGGGGGDGGETGAERRHWPKEEGERGRHWPRRQREHRVLERAEEGDLDHDLEEGAHALRPPLYRVTQIIREIFRVQIYPVE